MRVGNKRAVVLAALLLLSFATIMPLALADRQPPTPAVPNQCTSVVATGWTSTPVINVAMQVRNDEDSGLVGYWALDDFQQSNIVWENPTTNPPTFCALLQYSGEWQTFQGALSPETGATQASDGSGPLTGGIVAYFTSSAFLGQKSTKPLTGFIGMFDYGGTRADILKGTYATQTGDTSRVYFLSFYFTGGTAIQQSMNEPAWAFTYTQQGGSGYGSMWVNALSGNFGDILTQSY